MSLPKQVTLVEVGPRDGLQNEPEILDTAIKVELINRLSQTGLSVIEATSFVSPKWIPQLADHQVIMTDITPKKGVSYPVLIPNTKGLENALAVGVTDIAVFTAASETFSQKNTNCSIDESLERIEAIMELAKQNQLRVRGYISCVVACPYEGKITPDKVLPIVAKLLALGCYEVSLGETIGKATARDIHALLDALKEHVNIADLALHCHDTYGQALTNVYAGLQQGIATIDCSIAGLGGCPYAQGASGNLATEDVLYLLNGLGIETGVDLKKLLAVSDYICQELDREPNSKVALAYRGVSCQ